MLTFPQCDSHSLGPVFLVGHSPPHVPLYFSPHGQGGGGGILVRLVVTVHPPPLLPLALLVTRSVNPGEVIGAPLFSLPSDSPLFSLIVFFLTLTNFVIIQSVVLRLLVAAVTVMGEDS